MKITQVQIRDMWSFDAQTQTFDSLHKVTVIIGKNNCGKSNVLKAIQWFGQNPEALGSPRQDFKPKGTELHEYVPEQEAKPALTLSFTLLPSEMAPVLEGFKDSFPQTDRNRVSDCLAEVVSLCFDQNLTPEDRERLQISAANVGPLFDLKFPLNALHPALTLGPWRQQHLPRLRIMLSSLLKQKTTFLDGWRLLNRPIPGGGNIVTTLLAMKNPEHEKRADRLAASRIEQLFRKLTGLADATLTPQRDGQKLNVEWRSRYLPIESFGDGIQHLLMIAFDFSRQMDHVFLIEEPETHLHPELQRQLLEVMKHDDRRNQFIVTTHSPVFLNSGATECVFRVDYDGDASRVVKCAATADIYRTLDDLDVRAGDILQANCVIWVEGPTDRMFLHKCLALKNQDLVEGIHYQVVCYGGRLRSHFTMDEERNDLINLLRLSRHVVFVCDSDKESETAQIDETKQRLQQECNNVGGLFWITDGREIENYIPDLVLTRAYQELLPSHQKTLELPQFEKLDAVIKRTFTDLPTGDKWKSNYGDNKVDLMPAFLKHLTASDLRRLALDERLDQLIAHINKAKNTPATNP
ncbi:MAG: AAA family ATPase [Verrucomicrobiia bacterium]|jgi:predicted ATPase